jgi:hypothetical protein
MHAAPDIIDMPVKTSREVIASACLPAGILLSAAALAISVSQSHAGLCFPRIDARLAARAAPGLTAPQSIAAQLHHQPTVASVAAAEARLAAAAYGMARRRSLRCP